MASILIVDDASSTRKVLKKIVLRSGHNVVAEAGTGDEAIVMCRQFKPDLVLLDMLMPPG